MVYILKAFSFCLPPPDNDGSTTLAVFKSGIDALSHFEIMKIAQAERNPASMPKNLLSDFDCFRLSLSGTASAALIGFLERNPDIQNIYLCLDNDTAGGKATECIIKELMSDSRFADKNITVAPPPLGKDYNTTLTGIRQILTERKYYHFKVSPDQADNATPQRCHELASRI